MKKLLFFISIICMFITVPAMAMCNLDANKVVGTNSYFGTRMVISDNKGTNDSLTYTHVDDPRMIVNFSIAAADPVGNVARSVHVSKLDDFAKFQVNGSKSQGRWADKSIYPHDPVAWVVVEETKILEVGDALVGHMEIRFGPTCILIADFVSPASQNLKSRWIQMVQEVTSLRETGSRYQTPITWLAEDTTPTGWKGVAGGFLSPLAVIGIICLLLGQFKHLEAPSGATRTVLGSCSILVFGAIIYQYHVYLAIFDNEFASMKHLDSFLLLLSVGILCFLGVFMSQRYAIIGLISACVGGFTLTFSSFLNWTPDRNISIAVGLSMIFMGGLAFYAWSYVSNFNLKKKQKESLLAQ